MNRRLVVAACDVQAGDVIGVRTVRYARMGADRIVIDFGDSSPIIRAPWAKVTVTR